MRRIIMSSFFRFATYQKGFPYVFGGVKTLSPPNIPLEGFLQNSFGEKLFEGFEYAYKNTLEALNEEDNQFLENTCEKNLSHNINYTNTSLVNPDARIIVKPLVMAVHFGVPFKRNMQEQFRKQPTPGNPQGFSFFLYTSQNPSYIASLPIIQLKIEFESNYKLIKEGSTVDDRIQKHVVQFQTVSQGSLQFSKLFSMLSSGIKGFTPKSFMENLIGKNYSWKISDIDYFLKGNEWDRSA